MIKRIGGALAIALFGATPLSATLIFGSMPISLGSFAAGTYTVSATGVIDFIGNGTFLLRPDGTPSVPVTAVGYEYFNPSGAFHDFNISGPGTFGPGGSTIKLGALMGTFTQTPTGPGDYFLIGLSDNVTLAAPGQIFAQVNDTFYGNDVGGYDVTVAPAALGVPEPAIWAFMIVGFGAVGAVMRYGRRKASLATA